MNKATQSKEAIKTPKTKRNLKAQKQKIKRVRSVSKGGAWQVL